MPAPKGHAPYPGCEKGGRPKEFTDNEIELFADELMEWLQDESHFWLKDFCLDRMLNPDLMSIWAKQNKKFSGVYEVGKHLQEQRILKNGYANNFNSGLVKFTLMNKHGWAERQETKLASDAENPLSFVLNVVSDKSKDLIDGQDQADDQE